MIGICAVRCNKTQVIAKKFKGIGKEIKRSLILCNAKGTLTEHDL